ncbi:MAG: Uncharacterized protein SCO4840 [uncultured Nocardioidaceae bacterium]|uniref:Uncharacterized protein SCO4840 n=1 Tax=uncultured Nocardioidaceae bacterium TaxID=253824 RepID=A0A6J4LWY1_9ACTN|nr:MAG: Uncharacterized protein SCO4840 [uncultured Nocardioidaceae bacterium]
MKPPVEMPAVRTIGVAIAVPDPWGSHLRKYRSDLGDPAADLIPTHITLVPPHDTVSDALPAIEQHLAEAAAINGSFAVHLRGTGTFRPVSPVVFVAIAEGIAGCELLALSVRRGPLEMALRYPYHPHVTVAHDLDEDRLDQAFDELSDFECEFEVDSFSLYAHDATSGWEPFREFSLTRSASG